MRADLHAARDDAHAPAVARRRPRQRPVALAVEQVHDLRDVAPDDRGPERARLTAARAGERRGAAHGGRRGRGGRGGRRRGPRLRRLARLRRLVRLLRDGGLGPGHVEVAARSQDVDDVVVLVAALGIARLAPIGVPDLQDELADLPLEEGRARVVVAVAGVVELLDDAGAADAPPAVVGVALRGQVCVERARREPEVHVLVVEEVTLETLTALGRAGLDLPAAGDPCRRRAVVVLQRGEAVEDLAGVGLVAGVGPVRRAVGVRPADLAREADLLAAIALGRAPAARRAIVRRRTRVGITAVLERLTG